MSYKSDLLDRLKDPSYRAGYLSAAMEDSSEAFLVALRDVAKACKGMANLANEAKVNRENLYRILSKDGNPRLSSLVAIMGTLGLRLRVEPAETEAASEQGTPAPEQKQAATFHYIGLSRAQGAIMAMASQREWLDPARERLIGAATEAAPATAAAEQTTVRYLRAMLPQTSPGFTTQP